MKKILKITINGKVYYAEVEEISSVETSTPTAEAVSAPSESKPEKPASPQPAPEEAKTASVTPPKVERPRKKEVIKSPLPGKILDVKVAVGSSVKKGETVVVLEAMKMENPITSPRDGTVVEVFVQKGDNVENNAPLVAIE